MTTHRIGRLAVLAMLVPSAASAVDEIKGFGAYQPNQETVELFQAIEDGRLEVRVIPRDSTQSRLLVENKSGKPLNVLLPAAMAAMPVLAQFQGMPDLGKEGTDKAPQPLGLGTPRMQNQGGNQNPFFNLPNGQNRGPMNFMPMNIAPEIVGQIKLGSFCLEHGRPNPKPSIPYRLTRIDEVTAKPEVSAICAMLGRGEIRQEAAQAAAWHLNCDMSWEELKQKRTDTILEIHSKLVFTAAEISEAVAAVKKVEEEAGKPQRDAGGSLSVNR